MKRIIYLCFCLLLVSTWAINPGSYKIDVRRDAQGLDLISIRQLDTLLKLHGEWSTIDQSWLWQSPVHLPLKIHAGLPLVAIGSQIMPLGTVPQSNHSGFWVPAYEIVNIIDTLGSDHLIWDTIQHQLIVQSRVDLQGVQVWDQSEQEVAVSFDFTRNFAANSHCADRECHILFPLLKVSDQVKNISKSSKHIQQIYIDQDRSNTWLTIQFDTPIDSLWQNQSKDKQELWSFRLRKTAQNVVIVPADEIQSPTHIAPGPSIPLNSNPKVLRDIIIDPGHGGKDAGASGSKTKEKDITLALAKALKTKLEGMGFRVRLTREDDAFVELSERPKIASRWKGDLFLSLHCNSVEDKSGLKNQASGFKAYILRDAQSKDDDAIASRENSYLIENGNTTKAEISPVDWIQHEHQLNLYAKESETFAKFLVTSLETQKKIPKMATGAGQAGFLVLLDAFMPAVLLEVGFISNPQDEEVLNSTDGQSLLADKIAAAVDQYRQDLKQR